ncbi:MAG TPA: hypothetical protein VES95_09525 [Dermatophilaceae bacterium]|nr:hypothetical protein [Dermatophilaceae bacterium]
MGRARGAYPLRWPRDLAAVLERYADHADAVTSYIPADHLPTDNTRP